MIGGLLVLVIFLFILSMGSGVAIAHFTWKPPVKR